MMRRTFLSFSASPATSGPQHLSQLLPWNFARSLHPANELAGIDSRDGMLRQQLGDVPATARRFDQLPTGHPRGGFAFSGITIFTSLVGNILRE
jgi:hypothetical protein